jgi:hypothetical protein
MTTSRPDDDMATNPVPDPLPPAIGRPRDHIEAVLAQSLIETGGQGRAVRAWTWALTGACPSPVTLSPAKANPPTLEEIAAEAAAAPEGSTAPPGVPTDFCDQLREARHILRWLIAETDEIPLDDENRGRFIGARDDYARTDEQIRAVRDNARRSLDISGLPDPMYPADALHPWRWHVAWMHAAWLRGVRDLLDWVLGDRVASPLGQQVVGLPAVHDLEHEDLQAEDIASQGRPSGVTVDPDAYPPPQYAEAIQESIRWLRGEATSSPVELAGY